MSVPSVPAVSLGSSGIRVSRLALGSWRTYERISRDQGIRVMQTPAPGARRECSTSRGWRPRWRRAALTS